MSRSAAPQGFGAAVPDDILARIERRIAALDLDLSGLCVVTEAATGAYASTAVIAALAGARVHAIARDTARHGSFEDAAATTLSLAARAGVAHRISVARVPSFEMLRACDILTNSGHLRPITSEMIAVLRPEAVIALMFEAWEFRETDLDLTACRKCGIRVAAVNERHPAVGVFPFLGPLAVRLLEEADRTLESCRIALLCDNPFASFIESGLVEAGALVGTFDRVDAVPESDWHVALVALDPNRRSELGEAELSRLAKVAPGALLGQFWGDIDRSAAARYFPAVWPPHAPGKGHMAILLTALGPEPIVRLQTGGLRAAEIAYRGETESGGAVAQLL